MKTPQKLASLLIAAALSAVSTAFAANNFYIGPDGGSWTDSANWSATVTPSATYVPFILSNSSAVLSNTVLPTAIGNLTIGAYYVNATSLFGGTGSLTIDNSTLTVAALIMTRMSYAGYSPTGVSSLTLSNGSTLTLAGTSAIGYYTVTGGQALDDRQRAEMTIDATSNLAYAYILNVGRSTIGTLSLLGSDTASVAAQANIDRLTLGAIGTTDADPGSGHIYMGTNSVMTVNRTLSIGVSGGSYSNSFTMNGATLQVGSATFSDVLSLQMFANGTISATNSTISVYRNASVSGLVSLVGSTLSVGTVGTGNMTLSSATLSYNQSTASVLGTLVATSSTLTLTNSSLYIATAATLAGAQLVMDNAVLTVAGMITSTNSGEGLYNRISNSTIAAGSLQFSFADNGLSVSNTVITLSSATAQTAVKPYYTSALFLNNSSVSIGTNGLLAVGATYIGSQGSSTISLTDGAFFARSLISIGAYGSLSGTGLLSVQGGSVTMTNSGVIAIGNGGTGVLSVGGTGVVVATALSMSGNATVSGNVYIQGTQATPVTASGQATFDTMTLASGAAFTLGTVHINPTASISLVVAGTPESYQTVTFDTLAFDGQCTINIDYSGLLLTESSYEITVILANTVSGIEYNPILSTSGLQAGYQVSYSDITVGEQTGLLATITAIPEPAVSALLIGLLGTLAVVRRRRR